MPASSSRAGSRPGRGATSGGGANMRWSSRASGRAERIARPGMTQTAIVIGHKAQIGRLSIACSHSHKATGYQVTVSSPSLGRYSADPDLIRRGAQRALSTDRVTIAERCSGATPANPARERLAHQASCGRCPRRLSGAGVASTRVVMRELCYGYRSRSLRPG
jgi:hypothetical protein